MHAQDDLPPWKLADELAREELRCGLSELPPPDLPDPVLEIYKRDVDRTLLIKNLELTPAQRADKLVDFNRLLQEMRRAGQQVKTQPT